MRGRLLLGAVLALVLVLVVLADPAAAQTGAEPVTEVDIDFDVGAYDAALGDWPVVAVLVTGALDAGQELTVEVRGDGDEVLWSATGDVTSATTRFDVDDVLLVGDIASAGISQPTVEVLGEVVEAPGADVFRSGAGGSGSGQIALSMILALVVATLVFRSPLPSASTQRWRR